MLPLALSLLLLGGCVVGYTLVNTGPATIGEAMTVNASAGYNLAPHAPAFRKGSQVWTQDGLLLDRLILVPAVADGESILNAATKDAAMPVFRGDMLPNEIEELMESTIVKYAGEGNAVVNTSNLRPHRYGEHRGIMFDLDANFSDSPTYKGVAGAFVVDGELYALWYMGAEPYYYGKHLPAAEAIIRSARLAATP